MTPEQIAKSGSEHSNQTALFCWAALQTHTYPELRWLYAIPNGEARSVITGARLKASGTRRGVWDIFLPVTRAGWPGLYLEMKKPGGKLTAEQKEFRDFVDKQGYFTAICYGWEEAIVVIKTYLEY